MASYLNATTSLCAPSTFTFPDLYGAQILSLSANLVTNFSESVKDLYYFNHHSIKVENATFCNVTVSYTHPGQEDHINIAAWLPVDTWNERLQAVGGGGWVAGGTNFFLSASSMAGAIGSGYATITTDAGLGAANDASPWALLSPGNVNLYNLQNLAFVSLNDEAIIGKSLINDFYGKPPKYSYWSGCSQGGRQGLMLAQRYPGVYDGIAAAAPAINWNSFFTATFWPQLVMNLAGEYPQGCELDELTAAAISACDGLDGVVDGLVSNIKACDFDPFTLVGTEFNCSTTGTNTKISNIAAEVANSTWTGPRTADGRFLWYGPNIGADLSGILTSQALASTTCTANGTCKGSPNPLGTQWITLFIEKNPDFDLASMTHEQFDEILHAGWQQYHSIIDTDDADLSGFKAAGGKMMTYHGLSDQIIPASGTEDYYNEVTKLDPNVHDYYRYFEVPGLQHCANGNGGQPTAVFDALVAWVEDGIAPESLPVSPTGLDGTAIERILCPYPSVATYDGVSDPATADGFSCA
ncbi:hypothetical protein V496_04933 [Pseudogymnoascus sp. VKM F-4515 (FW-2607)]|nr:hypothetical protein V496_04933 [Pseudogymnoascus sp. VKM F-4515 (FW-2607)]KFY77079.1 hypothetical protein V498_09423 [Pseudogymnoascus sp. VKM F-4517 (FW-2822)]